MNPRKTVLTIAVVLMVPGILPLMGFTIFAALCIGDMPRTGLTGLRVILPLLGVLAGLLSGILLYRDMLRGFYPTANWRPKQCGLAIGVGCAIYGTNKFEPNLQPLLCYYIPPIVGALLLLATSFLRTPESLSQPRGKP
jgi:hypothetical protein